MNQGLLQVILYTLFPVGTTLLGGIIATFRAPGPRLGSALQHFAAGTVFAAVAIELLPDVISKHAPIATLIGFAVGIILMLVIQEISKSAEATGENTSQSIIGLLIAIGVDITIDGFLVGIGFVAGAKQGILITVALSLELLSLGLATVTALHRAKFGRAKSILTVVGLALLLLAGAFIGAILLSALSGAAQDGVLAFGVAALLYLVTEELLVEAHEVPETAAITVMFFLGFLILLMINLLV